MTIQSAIRDVSQLALAMTRFGRPQAGPETIAGVDARNWPSAMQPVDPIGPPGSQSLAWPFMTGQNLMFTPRAGEECSAADLRTLAKYPLARVCLENVKDQICQLEWRIQLRKQPGETPAAADRRRQLLQKGDANITMLSELFEMPDKEKSWPDWLRPILEDMLVIDAASVLKERTFSGRLDHVRYIPGDNICRYIDDRGITPRPPSPAYAQLWSGTPRVNLTTDQLAYKPRNIVPRNTVSSHLYGLSPVESIADEIRIGLARLLYIWSYYKTGSIPNMIQVVPPNVQPDKMREAMDWFNSELAGNAAERRQFRVIQGFQRDGEKDQFLFPKEPTLADVFDDLHIRKVCFALGTSPQRLQRSMNRGSAASSQVSAEEEGIRPWKAWVEDSIVNPIIWAVMGNRQYEMVIHQRNMADTVKVNKMELERIAAGRTTINEVRVANREEPSDDPAADELALTTAQGRVPIGQSIKPIEKPVGEPVEGPMRRPKVSSIKD